MLCVGLLFWGGGSHLFYYLETCGLKIVLSHVHITKPMAGLLRILAIAGFSRSSKLTASQSHQFLNQSCM